MYESSTVPSGTCNQHPIATSPKKKKYTLFKIINKIINKCNGRSRQTNKLKSETK